MIDVNDRANYLAALPWTYLGPVRREEGELVWYELRIKELPDFFLADETIDAVFREVRPALVAMLYSFLEHGDPVPQPPVRWVFGGWAEDERKTVKGVAPNPAPPAQDASWQDKVPGFSGNQLAVA